MVQYRLLYIDNVSRTRQNFCKEKGESHVHYHLDCGFGSDVK